MSLLDVNEIAELNKILPTVKDSKFLSMGVYPMTIKGFERMSSKKDGIPMLRVTYDTGFPLQDATKGNRLLNDVFMLHGLDDKGNKRIEALAEWLKNSLGVTENLSETVLNKQTGRSVAVATKKDKEGYISLWYTGKIENLASMQKNYKSKDESNGATPGGAANGTAHHESEAPPTRPLESLSEEEIAAMQR